MSAILPKVSNEAFFVQELVRHAKSLPFPEMICFLGGFCEIAGVHPSAAPVRAALEALHTAESQLELIASTETWPASAAEPAHDFIPF